MNQRKYFVGVLAAVMCCLTLAGCGAKSVTVSGKDAAKQTVPKGDIGTDICEEFTADFIYSATGKTIVKVEPSTISGVFACDYYTAYSEDYYKLPNGKVAAGGPHITIVLDNLSIENQKKGVEFLGGTVETDARISDEHWIVRRFKDNSVWGVHIVINPNRYVWADQAGKALTDDELIVLGAHMADKMHGRSGLALKKNPIDFATANQVEIGASQEAVARQFFEQIGSGKIDVALSMMDATNTTKKMWADNFAAVKSLKVYSAVPAFEDEWTATRQVFKLVLEVKASGDGQQFGWENGKNFRWLTLEKRGEAWVVTEIANNP